MVQNYFMSKKVEGKEKGLIFYLGTDEKGWVSIRRD